MSFRWQAGHWLAWWWECKSHPSSTQHWIINKASEYSSNLRKLPRCRNSLLVKLSSWWEMSFTPSARGPGSTATHAWWSILWENCISGVCFSSLNGQGGSVCFSSISAQQTDVLNQIRIEETLRLGLCLSATAENLWSRNNTHLISGGVKDGVKEWIEGQGKMLCEDKVASDIKKMKKKMQIHTAFNFQGAVLFIQWVSSQIHHACCSGGDSGKYRIRVGY